MSAGGVAADGAIGLSVVVALLAPVHRPPPPLPAVLPLTVH